MRIGLNAWAQPVAWWPPGASYAADFVAGRYMKGGLRADAAAAFSFSRSSAKYAADSSGTFLSFATNVPARTSAGLSIEAASANLLTDPVGLTGWVTTLASVAVQAGPVLGIFTYPMLVTDTAANVIARIRHPANQSVTADLPSALTYWFQAGSAVSVGLFGTGNSGSSRLVVALPSGTVSNTSSFRGMMSVSRLVQVATGMYCAQVLWTPNFTGPCEIGIGPGTAVIGDTIIALGAMLELGTRFTSPMIASGVPSSRAADALTLHLPAGTHQLTFNFTEGNNQTVAGVIGSYAVPTDLNGSTIRSVVGVPA